MVKSYGNQREKERSFPLGESEMHPVGELAFNLGVEGWEGFGHIEKGEWHFRQRDLW